MKDEFGRDYPEAYDSKWHPPVNIYVGADRSPLETSVFWNRYLFENTAYLKRRVDELEERIAELEKRLSEGKQK